MSIDKVVKTTRCPGQHPMIITKVPSLKGLIDRA